jgi:hypothetical protein
MSKRDAIQRIIDEEFRTDNVAAKFEGSERTTYFRAIKLVLMAIDEGFKLAPLADWCGIESSYIHELTSGRMSARKWSGKSLYERCSRIINTLKHRGIFLSGEFSSSDDVSEANVDRHYDALLKALDRPYKSACFDLMCLAESARGACHISSHGGRQIANSLFAFQAITEHHFGEVMADDPECTSQLLLATRQLLKKGRAALKKQCQKAEICSHKIPGYAGYCMVLSGTSLKQESVVLEGFGYLVEALGIEHDQPGQLPACHWVNAVQAIRHVFDWDPDLARRLALDLLEVAKGCTGHRQEVFSREMAKVDTKVLQPFWGPDYRLLFANVSASKPVGIRTLSKTIRKFRGAAAIIMLSGLSMAFVSQCLASGSRTRTIEPSPANASAPEFPSFSGSRT